MIVSQNNEHDIVRLSLPFLVGMLLATFALQLVANIRLSTIAPMEVEVGGIGTSREEKMAVASEIGALTSRGYSMAKGSKNREGEKVVGVGAFAGWMGAGALVAATLCIVVVATRRGRTSIALATLFFCLGIFCRTNVEIFPQGSFPAQTIENNALPEDGNYAKSEGDKKGKNIQIVNRNKGNLSKNGGKETENGLPSKTLQQYSSLIASVPFQNTATLALLRALLTGQKDQLSRSTINSFRTAGASHILALSGLHLGIIYIVLSSLLALLGNSVITLSLRSLCIVVFCGFYVLITGASPSIVRAFIYILIRELSRHIKGRRISPLGIWCTALLIQLSTKPSIIDSPGFQLSYLAMLGITILFPLIKNLYPSSEQFKKVELNPMRFIWNSMSLSISCQAFTAPCAWLHFGTFPKYFLLTNLLALPLTEAFMIIGIACIVLNSLQICPQFLIVGADYIAKTLVNVLRIISEM